jgi:hypothetical protein
VDAKREAVAHHEAGHAVAMLWFEQTVVSVRIVADDAADSLGACLGDEATWPDGLDDAMNCGRFEPEERVWVEETIVSLLAGEEAEARLTGQRNKEGATFDRQAADDAALRLCNGDEEEATAFLRWLKVRTRNLIRHPGNWNAVRDIAAALLEKDRLTGEEARKLFCEAQRRTAEARLPQPGPSTAPAGAPTAEPAKAKKGRKKT